MDSFWHFLTRLHEMLSWESLALIPALVLLVSAVAAVTLRNLFHCALSLTLGFVALGVLFIALGAEFIGFVQITVCVGAVAVLIVFAILLTHPEDVEAGASPLRGWHAVQGGLVAYAVLVALLFCIFLSPFARGPDLRMTKPGDGQSVRGRLPGWYLEAAQYRRPAVRLVAPVEKIGENLMGDYMVPLQATGLLLTVALIGAALLAKERRAL